MVPGRDSGNQAGPDVVLAADVRLATDGGKPDRNSREKKHRPSKVRRFDKAPSDCRDDV